MVHHTPFTFHLGAEKELGSESYNHIKEMRLNTFQNVVKCKTGYSIDVEHLGAVLLLITGREPLWILKQICVPL